MSGRPTFGLDVAKPAIGATPFAQVALYSDIATQAKQGLKVTLPGVAALHLDNEAGYPVLVQPAAGNTRWTYLLGPFESLDFSSPAAPFDSVVLFDPVQAGLGLPGVAYATAAPQITALGLDAFGGGFVFVSGSDVPLTAARGRHMPDRNGAVQLLSVTFQNIGAGGGNYQSPPLWTPGAHTLVLDLNIRSLAAAATLTPAIWRKSLIGVFPIVLIPAWTGAALSAAGTATYCLSADSVAFWDEALVLITATDAAQFDVAVGVR